MSTLLWFVYQPYSVSTTVVSVLSLAQLILWFLDEGQPRRDLVLYYYALRVLLAIPQFTVHLFLLIPARTCSPKSTRVALRLFKMAGFGEGKPGFYNAISKCNYGLMFMSALSVAAIVLMADYMYTVFRIEITVLALWTFVLTLRAIAAITGKTEEWFTLRGLEVVVPPTLNPSFVVTV